MDVLVAYLRMFGLRNAVVMVIVRIIVHLRGAWRGMVKLHIKRGDESQFLYETSTEIPLSQLVPHLVRLFNGRLKVDRLCQGLGVDVH